MGLRTLHSLKQLSSMRQHHSWMARLPALTWEVWISALMLLIEGFCDFPHSNQTSAGIRHSERLCSLTCTSFPIHHSHLSHYSLPYNRCTWSVIK